MLVVLGSAVLLLMAASCRAAFMLPQPQSSSLAKNVTATCSSGSCTPTMNESTCVTEKVCTLTCPTRTDFPATQVRTRRLYKAAVSGSLVLYPPAYL